MKAISVLQAKALDLEASQKMRISTIVMMENAGIRIADFILQILKRKNNKKVAVFCGKGNNAGDGLVVSRQLISRRINVDTYLLAKEKSLSQPAYLNLKILKAMTKKIRRIKTEKDLRKIRLSDYGLLVDAIFGIGLKGKVKGIFKKTIQKINSSQRTVICVDVPSGLDADRGEVLGEAVKADYTVCLVAPKRGELINQGKRLSARLITRHIGFPYKGI